MKKLAGFLGVCLLVLVSSQSSVVAQTFTNPSYCPKEKIKEKFPFSSPLLAITVNGTQIYLEPFCYRELEGGRIEIDPNWEQANIIELDVGMQLPLPTGGKVNKIRVHREAAPAFRKAFELIRQKGLESFIKTFDGTFVPRHINWNPTKPLSYHSWGIAIDLNAQENPLGGPASEGNIKLWEEAFDPAGFNWLGPNYDPMHFELPVTIVSSSPALPPPPTPPSEQTPYISGVSPDQPSAQPSRQWLTVRGSGFVPDSQVILSIGGSSYPIPPDRTRFVSPTQIDVYVGLTESGTWTIQVVNPGGRYSNTFSFQVIPTVGQPPFGARPAPYQCSQPSHYISMKEAANYALAAGFRGEAAAVIVAIAWAESDGNRYACRYNPPTDKNPTGSWDRGILQINDYWHSEITDDQAFDPARAFQAAYSISKGGTDFGDWCAYWLDCKKRIGKGQGRYRQHLDAARQAIQEITNPPVGDSDHDGIPDSQDRCPYEPGPSWNGGCPTIPPVPDSDNDGIPDGQDQCPYEPGPSWNNGCPEVSPPLPRNQPPIAWFTFSPINPSIGQPVRFDASSSFDPDPGDYITQYRWDFNDDRIFDVDGPIAYHTFSYSASYQVTLMVVDSRGAASFQHQVISVSGSITPPPPLPPVADSDNDGIPDSQDRCPYQPGPSWNSGCPEDEDLPPPPPPLEDDSDNDGIPDSQDRCRYQPGPSWNGGCPVPPPPDTGPPPPPSPSSLVIVPKSSSLHCTRIGKTATLKFNVTNTGSIPVTITGVTENSPNFSITGFKAKTIKPGKSKTISVKVQCSAIGFFPPPFGVKFTTSDGQSVGPAGYDISVTPALVGRFSLDGVGVAVSKERVRFFAWGSGIKSIGVQVLDLTGKLIFSREESGSVLAFNDRTLANGVYLYVVRVRGFDGREYVSEVHKLVILR